MSGICGIINTDGAPVLERELEAMAHAAVHRGPDGIGYWVSGRVGFARLALEITPESAGEFRPCVDEEAGLLLCADLRLDNRQELIELMGKKGQELKAVPTDSELVMAAYRVWGLRCAEHLLGDFAFAIWDDGRQRVYAARDVMGMRALYYRIEPRRVLFATEVKQILAASGVPVRMHEQAVGAHLAGIFAPLEWSFYEGIDQLAPGTALTVERGSRHLWRYWDIDPNLRIRYADERQYEEHFLELFKQAVGCRLRSAKPVGISLSGGVDSGSVASTAGWLYQEGQLQYKPDFRAYCWAFEQLPQCDERGISNLITQRYHIPVTEVPADDAWPLNGYPDHGPDRDEPFVFYYNLLIDRVLERAACEKTGVLLTGERGDALSNHWVYDYPGMLFRMKFRCLQRDLSVHRRLLGLSRIRMAKRYLVSPLFFSLFPNAEKSHSAGRVDTSYPEHMSADFAKKIDLADIARQAEPPSNVPGYARRQRHRLIFSPMSVRRAVLLDRQHAGFGLGFADPWSDVRLAQFAVAIPQMLMHRITEYKRMVKRSLKSILPAEITETSRKGNPMPLYDRGIRHREKDRVLDLITNSQVRLRGYADTEVIRRYYDAYLRGEPERYDLWWFLTLEMWLRLYWK